MRLLLCHRCATLEELPDFDGHPTNDVFLEDMVRRHNHEQIVIPDEFKVIRIDTNDWLLHRDEIIKKINQEAKTTGFDGWVYEAVSTYKEDALKCYSRHSRPTQGCIDYWSDSKRIGRPTDIGRAAVKDQYKLGETDPHLCQFCPVHSFVQTEQRYKKGLYKE